MKTESRRVRSGVGWAVKVDTELHEQWNKRFLSTEHVEERAQGDLGEVHDAFEFALPDGAGGYLLIGWVHDEGPDDKFGWIVNVDAQGTTQWEKTDSYVRQGINSFQDTFADGIRLENGYLLVGRTLAGEFLDEEHGEGWVVKLDDHAEVDWDRTYNTVDETHSGFTEDPRHDEFKSLTSGVDGGYILVGEASPDGPSESTHSAGWVVKIDDDGTPRWSDTYRLSRTADNEFLDVIPANDRGYVLVGVAGADDYVRPSKKYQTIGDGWVLKLDKEGEIVWEQSPGGDGFRSIAPAPNGYLLVGSRDGTAWAITIDEDGNTIPPEHSSETPDSQFSSVVHTPHGHLGVGRGRNRDTNSIDGLVMELASDETGFQPAIHGFGFGNSPADFANHDHDAVRLSEVNQLVRDQWQPKLANILINTSAPFLQLLSAIAYREINQHTAVDGHCLGMVYSALRYFNNPDALPTTVEVASEITDVTVANGVVGDDIDYYQNIQLLDFDIFAKLVSLKNGFVDQETEIETLEGLVTPETPIPVGAPGHAALAYKVTTSTDAITKINLYDPNIEATAYNVLTKTFEVERRNGDVTVAKPFRPEGLGEKWSLVALTSSPAADVLTAIFSSVLVFELQSPATLSVTGPDGDPVTRLNPGLVPESERGKFVYDFAAKAGEYTITVEGTGTGTYTVEAKSCRAGEVVSSLSVTKPVSSNDRDEYILERSTDGRLVIEQIAADVRVQPTTIEIPSNQRGEPWLTASIEIPENTSRLAVEDIDVDTVRMNGVSAVDTDEYSFSTDPDIEDRDSDGLEELIVRFPREAVIETLERGEKSEVQITGEIGESSFIGTDTIHIRSHPERSTFEVLSREDDTEFSYRFTVAGEVTKAAANGNAADDDDHIIACREGATTVIGFTGDGQGDVFTVAGRIQSFVKTSGSDEFELRLAGEDITDQITVEPSSGTPDPDLDGSTFEILSTEDDSEFTYRFDVAGDVAKTVYGGNAADNEDQIVRCADGHTTVVGLTGDAAGDVFIVTGQLRTFERTSGSDEFELRLDDEEITPQSLPSDTL